MIIKAVKFQRDIDVPFEYGISFECDGDMDGRIIDSNGDIIKLIGKIAVYDCQDAIDILCISVDKLLE